MGRAVYLSPGYFSSYSGYSTESLLDGSIPDALNLFLQAIEWAAGIGVASSASEASSTDGSLPYRLSAGRISLTWKAHHRPLRAAAS